MSGPASRQAEVPSRRRTLWLPLLTSILAIATLAGALYAGTRPRLRRAGALQLLTGANLARDQANSVLADTELTQSRRLLARQAAPSRNSKPCTGARQG